MSTLTAKIQLRRDTASNWATNNPILAAGEVAFTSDVFYSGTDQQRFKIGDGVQTWSQLDYVPEGGGGYTPFKLLAKNNTPITHTGTATETLLLSYNLTGEFDLNDIVNISLFNLPTGSGSKTIRLKVNTTNDLTGATTLATYTATTTSITFQRTLYFSNTLSNVRVYAPTTSYASDRVTSFAGATTTTSVTYSFSGNVWILVSVQLVTTTDTCVLNSFDITRKR